MWRQGAQQRVEEVGQTGAGVAVAWPWKAWTEEQPPRMWVLAWVRAALAAAVALAAVAAGAGLRRRLPPARPRPAASWRRVGRRRSICVYDVRAQNGGGGSRVSLQGMCERTWRTRLSSTSVAPCRTRMASLDRMVGGCAVGVVGFAGDVSQDGDGAEAWVGESQEVNRVCGHHPLQPRAPRTALPATRPMGCRWRRWWSGGGAWMD